MRSLPAFVGVELKKDEIFDYIVSCGIRHPRIVYAQVIEETGNFTSWLYKNNKNLFGMKFATIRKTTAVGTMKGHAVYNSYKDSILDYKLWQECSPLLDGEDYFGYLLRRSYAGNENYIMNLKKILGS